MKLSEVLLQSHGAITARELLSIEVPWCSKEKAANNSGSIDS